MDPAQEIELHAQRYHKSMDELIARGDSPVQRFYNGATVFITGGSGFLGKQLIEKLLRSCPIKKLYLLARFKKGKTIQERLDHMLKEPIFDRIREQNPLFGKKIVPVEGDVAEINLGLSDKDWTMLTKEVNIIFHEAATVRFDEPLRKATLTNLRGTRETLLLAQQCIDFKKFVHVSTTFSHATHDRINTDVYEEFYPCPVPPDVMISLAEDVEESRLNNITQDLIKGWPNTYTFTKAISEELVKTMAADLPVCIIRPSVVLPAYFEPNPGWLDKHTLIGPSGVLFATGLGVLRVFLTDVNANLPSTPVDYVNNATIAAAWDSTERQKNGQTDIPIYNIARDLKKGLISETMRSERKRCCSGKSVWYAECIETKSKLLYFFLSWFYHYIPAYCIDFLLKIFRIQLPEGLTSIVDIYKMVDKLAHIYNYFTMNEWYFKDNNVKLMIDRLSDADKMIYNCDLSNIDFREYILVWGIGLRKYIIRDGLKNTEKGYRKQQILRIAHYIFTIIFSYILYSIVRTIFNVICYFLSYFI